MGKLSGPGLQVMSSSSPRDSRKKGPDQKERDVNKKSKKRERFLGVGWGGGWRKLLDCYSIIAKQWRLTLCKIVCLFCPCFCSVFDRSEAALVKFHPSPNRLYSTQHSFE